jgi:prepilin-type N-terminal cleavage/methylation domain-containing protein
MDKFPKRFVRSILTVWLLNNPREYFNPDIALRSVVDRQKTQERAVTLVEMLVVVSVIGILMLLVTPRIGPTTARRDVNGATESFAALFREARAGAIQRRQEMTVTVSSGFATTTMKPGGVLDTLGRPLNIGAEFGLIPTTSSGNMHIDANGTVFSGSPFTFVASKRGESDTLRITGLGIVQ